MKQTMNNIFSLSSLVLLVLNVQVIAFSNIPKSTFSSTKLAAVAGPVDVAPVETIVGRSDVGVVSSNSMIQNGVSEWLQSSSSESSSISVSLSERRPPTPEEIAEKKKNFNFWFWGGGFVAPMLATFYYFGFKFWRY